ncbi:MAG: hypothetical protein H7837_02980 [Magnetococcus sp. MYC-9]
MKHITRLFMVLLVLYLHGWASAAVEEKRRPENSANLLYGIQGNASPDYIKAAKWFHEVGMAIKSGIKAVIGVNAYNQIARTWEAFTSTIGDSFNKLTDVKRFEWKLTR